MSRTPKKTSKAKTAAPGNQPSTRHLDTDGDVLLPLLGAQLEPIDADGTDTPLRSLPCDENGNVFLPLLGDEEEAPPPGNTHTNLPSNEYKTMSTYRYAVSYLDQLGNLVVVKVWSPESGTHFSWLKMSHCEIAPNLRDHYKATKLWGIIDGNFESRELLVTIRHVDASVLKKGCMNRLIKSMIKHHTNANTISLPKFDDLQAYIAWNTRA